MIGLDSNVVLRLLLDDAPDQNAKLDILFAEFGREPESLLLTDVVLAEVIWSLRSAYRQDKAAQLQALRGLLGEAAFAFEHRAVVERAVALFEHAACGFADCLVAARHAQCGCAFTATFDRAMRTIPGVQVL